MNRYHLRQLLAISAVLLAIWSCLQAQEPVVVEFPFVSPSPIRTGDLHANPNSSLRPQLPVRNSGNRSVLLRIRPGTYFAGSGTQAVMTMTSAEATVPALSSVSIPLQVLCTQATRPDPGPDSRWYAVRDVSPQVAEKQSHLRRIVEGLAPIDTEIRALAPSVRIQPGESGQTVQYDGIPLSQERAHLLRIVDWATDEQGLTAGELNRSIVVQFAFWVLTDNYTEHDLARRLCEPRFASAQAREMSIRWGIFHLLASSGFKPELFEANSPESFYNRGVDALRANNLQTAEDMFLDSVDRRPDYVVALFNLAMTYSLKGQYDQARQAWERVTQRLPNDPEVWYNRAVVAFRIGQFDEAARFFHKVTDLAPTHALALEWLPRAQRAQREDG